METRQDYFNELPEEIKLQALEAVENCPNRNVSFENMMNSTVSKDLTLLCAFSFGKTKQGRDFWADINDKYFSEL